MFNCAQRTLAENSVHVRADVHVFQKLVYAHKWSSLHRPHACNTYTYTYYADCTDLPCSIDGWICFYRMLGNMLELIDSLE